jgi:hypothetical protein
MTSVGCSLGTTYIAKTQFATIQGKAVSAFLAASGYNRHFPRALIFSSRSHGGLEFVHLYLQQGKQSLKLLLRHLLHNTELGKQIQIDIAWIQLEAGISHPILENTQLDLDYLQDGWVIGIRRFLKTVDAEVHLPQTPHPQLYRQNDRYIMEIFKNQSLSTPDLRRLNRCRLYFQVARLSDITNVRGTHLYENVTNLDRPQEDTHPNKYPTSKRKWPRQPRPGHMTCQLWSRSI